MKIYLSLSTTHKDLIIRVFGKFYNIHKNKSVFKLSYKR